MSLGPYPTGDPGGMRTLAASIRGKADALREHATLVPREFQNLPIQAPFFSLSVFDVMAAGQVATISASRLGQVASLLEREATTLEGAQRRWERAKAALLAEQQRAREQQR